MGDKPWMQRGVDPNSHYGRCLEAVCAHGHHLATKVREGSLNWTAVERLMESYIDQPAFDLIPKHILMAQGMKYL